MAIQENNFGMQNAHGKIGNVVYKQVNGKTVITSYPDMSNVVRSKKQKNENSLFSRAVKFAQEVKADPSLLTHPDFSSAGFQSLYHAAVSWYVTQEKNAAKSK